MAGVVRRVARTMQLCNGFAVYKGDRRKQWKETRGGNVASWSRYNVNEFKSYFDSKVGLIDQECLEIINSLNS